MRWKTKKLGPPPRIGAQRFKVRFAFLPTYTEDEMVVWMEKYLAQMTWTKYTSPPAILVETESWSQGSTMWGEWEGKTKHG